MKQDYITGTVTSGAGVVPKVSTSWSRIDYLGALRVRTNIDRSNYKVHPGLYAAGSPDENSRVFATANYKLSFDHLRRALDGMNAWILVLNTYGINVWCAAGKKTFGTKELINRIRIHKLETIVIHRKLILPQLGATGIAAHEVMNQTGFSVIYGPVRASDIKAFVDAGLKATEAMRTITFTLKERMKLIPVELTYGKYYIFIVPVVFILLSGFNSSGFSTDNAFYGGGRSVLNLLAAYLAGLAITPALLPWIPFRRFSLKGLLIGWLVAVLLLFTGTLGDNIVEKISWFFMMGGLSSFCAMSFTGSSTFTSLSGVQKEMKTALPVQISLAVLGLIGFIVTRFITP